MLDLYSSPTPHVLSKRVVRLGFIIGFIALIGVLLSGLAAYRVHDQELTVEGIAMARAIDVHASLVQDRLTERELLARVASGLFRAPGVIKANMLQPLRSSIYAFKTDFVVASWIARLQPNELEAARKELASAGFANPMIRDFDDKPLDIRVARPADRCADGRRAAQRARPWLLPGRSYDQHPVLGPMFARAMAEGKPVASDPIPLLRPNGPVGLVLAAPVLQEGNVAPAGFVTFSYELAPLMLANDDLSLFSVVLKDPRNADQRTDRHQPGQRHLAGGGIGSARAVDGQERWRFGGRDWSLAYYAKTNAVTRAQQTAAIVAAIGLALTGIVCGLFGYVAYNNLRLSREIQVRIGFERRLTAVIDELNHRVKNILAVIQSIVTRTLRHGSDIDVARELLIGRIHAMSNVVSLLTRKPVAGRETEGAVRGARDTACRAHRGLRSRHRGQRARRAEPVAAVLRTGVAFRRGAVAGRQASAHRRALGSDRRRPRRHFHFRWEEFNTSEATRRADSDFGLILLDRVAPEALGGASKRYLHRCQLRLRTHRADGNRHRHDASATAPSNCRRRSSGRVRAGHCKGRLCPSRD